MHSRLSPCLVTACALLAVVLAGCADGGPAGVGSDAGLQHAGGTSSDGGSQFAAVDAGGVDAGVSDGGQAPEYFGNPCANDSACGPPDAGICISAAHPDGGPSGFAGGYCSAKCSGDGGCGASAWCVPDSNNGFACLGACGNARGGQDTCRDGYMCEFYMYLGSTEPVGVCVPNCTATGATCYWGDTCAQSGLWEGYCN